MISMVAAVLGAVLPAAAAAASPNILFLFSDDHAVRAISAYGGGLAETPNIDRIAREGAIFTRSYCANSICAPSRATILTGLHSHANGHLDNQSRFNGEQQTFPKILQAAGYQTAIRGKWHLRSDPTGFDSWMVLPGQGQYINPVYLTPDGQRQFKGYSADVTADLALEFLEKQRDPAKPFFLAVQFKAPHRPFLPPERHLERFDNTVFPEPPTLLEDYKDRPSPYAGQSMTLDRHFGMLEDAKVFEDGRKPGFWKWFGPGDGALQAKYEAHYQKRTDDFHAKMPRGAELVRWKYQAYLRDYLGAAQAVDDNVGRLLAALDRLGLAKNTLVVYASDQGFYLGEHGWFDKRWMLEESFAMPLLMRWPGVIPPGARVSALVQNIDYAPTFCEIAGAKVPQPMHGRSLTPLFTGKTPEDWRTSLYYAYYEFPAPHSVAPHEGAATARHKLIHFPATGEWELLDRTTDPLEVKNLHNDPAHAAVREELAAELKRLRAQYGVPDGLPRAMPAPKSNADNPASEARSAGAP